MTPLEKIKNGLIEGDLKMIASGYMQLTGEKITPPATAANIKPPRKKKVTKTTPVKKIVKSSPRIKNLFFDDGTIGVDMIESDKKLIGNNPPAQNISAKMDVECFFCHKTFKEHVTEKSVIAENYICRKCSNGRK